MTSPHDLALLRLAAQRLAGGGFGTATDAVRWLTCAQAQDYPGALTSIALRTQARTRAAVEEALTSGDVVRSWPMRGTLQLVAAEDLPWILELTTARLITGAAARRAALGLDDRMIEDARRLATEALVGGRELSRAGLLEIWAKAGLLGVKQRGYHLLWNLSQTGTLCFGPVRDGEQHVVLLDEWVPPHRRRQLERDAAIGEWALRYFRSHGPATLKDFGGWTKLLAADLRAGLALARPELERLELDGVEYFMDPRTPARLDECRDQARGVFLLPGFDEYMLGYQDRSAALPARFAQQIVPGGNGMFRPTVVADGQVVGTWKRTGKGVRRTVLATGFESFPDDVEAAIPASIAALADALP